MSCASILTGLYPYRHGLRTMHGREKSRLSEEVPTIEEELEHVDILPTILELVKPGSSAALELDGRSLVDYVEGTTTRSDDGRPAYSEVHNVFALRETATERQAGEMYSLIRDGLKLIHLPRNPALDRLHDLHTDPRELTNLISQRSADARALLDELRSTGAIDRYVPDPDTLSEEELRHLRSLGYVEGPRLPFRASGSSAAAPLAPSPPGPGWGRCRRSGT